MRRLALTVFTACGLAFLSACSGGTGLSTGTGSNTNSPTQFLFTNGSAQADDFFVSPAVTTPSLPGQALQVNAIAEKGSGPTAVVVPDATITWAARYVTAADPLSVKTYTVGGVPNGFKNCPFLAATAPTPPVPIYYQTSLGGLAPLPAGQGSQTVYIAAVPTVPAPYCLVLQATDVNNGLIGSVTTVVSNSP